MNVHWTDTAQDHLAAIHAYIARDSSEYAKRMVDRLTRRSQQIADFPLSGRRVPEYERDWSDWRIAGQPARSAQIAVRG